ncbi:hypothetical protein FHR34_003086 [Kitasatospora kifunensis]|uniref:Uncharacterized protein n=1 Tax=Kitasatospora kifunensis TaxID=58351 RepID=A0A7W7R2A4_KITKI|nr:hypothetical protein [Kitasatospora kifunensis]MBB4924093.1 hypothetical protein [Kitasatospora kifunensis]
MLLVIGRFLHDASDQLSGRRPRQSLPAHLIVLIDIPADLARAVDEMTLIQTLRIDALLAIPLFKNDHAAHRQVRSLAHPEWQHLEHDVRPSG